jgi:hypothetical protein
VTSSRPAALLALGLVLPSFLLACQHAGAPPRAVDASAEGQPDRIAALCARYQAQATSPPSFAVVQTIFDDACTSCHTAAADLDLSDGHAWSALVNHAAPASEACGQTLVIPGDSGSSYLFQKLTNPHPCFGAQMPIDELIRSAPLPGCVTALIGDWIDAGAPPLPPAADAGGGSPD